MLHVGLHDIVSTSSILVKDSEGHFGSLKASSTDQGINLYFMSIDRADMLHKELGSLIDKMREAGVPESKE